MHSKVNVSLMPSPITAGPVLLSLQLRTRYLKLYVVLKYLISSLVDRLISVFCTYLSKLF